MSTSRTDLNCTWLVEILTKLRKIRNTRNVGDYVTPSLQVLLVLFFVVFSANFADAQQGNTVPDARYARLAKGINLSQWFAYGRTESYSPSEFAWMRKQGITAVRLAFDPTVPNSSTLSSSYKAAFISQLGSAIDILISYGFTVVLDPHNNNKEYGVGLQTETEISAFVQMWSIVSSQYANRDPEFLMFEVLNEPDDKVTPEKWSAIQKQVISKIRQNAQNHTIVVTANDWSSIDPTVAMSLVHDSNVIYTFHFYEPFVFTHQGAYWSGLGGISGLEYPYSPTNAQTVLSSLKTTTLQAYLQQYMYEKWDATVIRNRIDVVANWAKRNNIRVWIGEFGYVLWAAPVCCSDELQPIPINSRAAWIKDVRTAAEQNGIGWCMWDFDNLVDKRKGAYTVLPEVMSALGIGVFPDIKITLSSGWNLLGNNAYRSIDVAATFGDVTKVTSVWKWNSSASKWAFYGPNQTNGGAAFAALRGYEVLTTINAGEGYWVNAKQPFSVQMPTGSAMAPLSITALPKGWHLIAAGDSPTPDDLSTEVGSPNVISMWAWNSILQKWYFYSPSLQQRGGAALSDYAASKGYLDLTENNKKLDNGTGLWVNRK